MLHNKYIGKMQWISDHMCKVRLRYFYINWECVVNDNTAHWVDKRDWKSHIKFNKQLIHCCIWIPACVCRLLILTFQSVIYTLLEVHILQKLPTLITYKNTQINLGFQVLDSHFYKWHYCTLVSRFPRNSRQHDSVEKPKS